MAISPKRKDNELHIPLSYAEAIGLVQVNRTTTGKICGVRRMPPRPFPVLLGRNDGVEQTFYVTVHPIRPLINSGRTLVVRVVRMEEKRVAYPQMPIDRGTR